MKKFLLTAILFFIFSFFSFSGANFCLAQESDGSSLQEENLEVRVTSVLEEKEVEVLGKSQTYQKLQAVVVKGSLAGEEIVLENGHIPMASVQKYNQGDSLLVAHIKDVSGNNIFYITDFVRRGSLFWLFFLFIVLTLGIARWRGLTSVLGMGVSFLIIFKLILPHINAGKDPVLMAVLGSFLIIPFTFYLSHGFGKKTTVAVLSTCIALLITGLFWPAFL